MAKAYGGDRAIAWTEVHAGERANQKRGEGILRETFDALTDFKVGIEGTPSPVKEPEKLDAVIFRENTEDVYAGIGWASGTDAAEGVRRLLVEEMGASIREGSGSSPSLPSERRTTSPRRSATPWNPSAPRSRRSTRANS